MKFKRKDTEFHEAGHAAMLFFFGNSENFRGIDMNPSGNYVAAVLDDYMITKFRGAAMAHLMGFLAGPCVDSLRGLLGKDWLNELLNNQSQMESRTSDISAAVEIAAVYHYHADYVAQRRMLRTAAKWTEEALSHPRLWAVVEALAKRLKRHQTMAAYVAWQIMGDAFGPCDGTPYKSFGKQWQRRFSIRPGEVRPDPAL